MIFERIQIHSNVFCCKDNVFCSKSSIFAPFFKETCTFCSVASFRKQKKQEKLNIQTNGISK